MRKTPIVLFVDVDGVPPPPANSSGALARMLERLARERVMLVFCSQRTRAQIESTRQAFGIFHPFITECGGAVFLPERYFGSAIDNTRRVGGYEALEFAAHYEHVVDTLRRAADRAGVGIVGFSDMSVEQVARECSLSLLEARLAKLREYAEPFRLLSSNPMTERRLFRAVETAGLHCRRGADFHLATTGTGPHLAIEQLTTLYGAAFGSVLTAAGEGMGTADLLPYVDAALNPIVLDHDDAQAGLGWLEQIVVECDNVRAVRTAARTARMAR